MMDSLMLDCGIKVVLDPMPNVRSFSLGLWVLSGSVFEHAGNLGISHFVEHIAFKGTEKRSAKDIAMETDAIGANLNAFTAKECTCFHIRALDEDLPLCVDILSDLVLNCTINPNDLALEKKVILEEIAMNEDSPEDLAFDNASKVFFSGTPFESDVLGEQETVSNMYSDDLRAYMHRNYIAENMIIAVSGSFDRNLLITELNRRFRDIRHGNRNTLSPFTLEKGLSEIHQDKDVEQVQTVLMFPGEPMGTAQAYALAVLSNMLGGSMSSRLFQHIREEKGLCYSVYSYPISYRNTGALCVYCGSTESQALSSLDCILHELDDLLENGVTEDEFIRCKQQLKGSYLLGMESVSAHMNAIGKAALLKEQDYDMDKILKQIESVTIEDVLDQIKTTFLGGKMTVSTVGAGKETRESMQLAYKSWWNRWIHK